MGKESFAARWREVPRGFLEIGAVSYGGPAIMGLMQTEFQEKRAWLSKERFLEGLALVSMLPGAGATQLGIYLGYVRAGWWGGLLAGLCFIVPAFAIMLSLTAAYAEYGALPAAKDVFYGLGPVVVGIFVVAVYRLGSNAIREAWPGGLAGGVGVACYGQRRPGLGAAVTVLILAGLARWAGGSLDPAALTFANDGQTGL